MSARPILRIPPLHDGDRLTVREYMRRYTVMPEWVRAELINGVVHMASALRSMQHGTPHGRIAAWLGVYHAETPGVESSIGPTLLLKTGANAPEPDCCLYVLPECGGNSQVDDDGYLTGSPELIVEVAASTARFDLNDKLRVYERNGVQEYLVWRVVDEAIDWFHFRAGRYERLSTSRDGHLRSRVFPGLWLNVPDLIRGNLLSVFKVLRKGLAGPAHKRFVERLAKAKARRDT